MGIFEKLFKRSRPAIMIVGNAQMSEPYVKAEYQRPRTEAPVVTDQTPRLSKARNQSWIKPVDVWKWSHNSERAAVALGLEEIPLGKGAPCEVALWKEGHGLPIWVIAAGYVVGELPDDGRVRDKLKRTGSNLGIAQAEIRHRTPAQVNAGEVEYGWRVYV